MFLRGKAFFLLLFFSLFSLFSVLDLIFSVFFQDISFFRSIAFHFLFFSKNFFFRVYFYIFLCGPVSSKFQLSHLVTNNASRYNDKFIERWYFLAFFIRIVKETKKQFVN